MEDFELLQLITSHYNLDELQTFCFGLGIPYEEIPGSTIGGKARELILYCARHRCRPQLEQAVAQATTRPAVVVVAPSTPVETPSPPNATTYVDFDLHVTSGGEVTANSSEGQASAMVATGIPAGIQALLARIEWYATDAAMLKQAGTLFYDWLFPPAIHTHFVKTEAVARSQGARMRLRLRVEADEIARLPLELAYRVEGGYFLSINPDTVLSRFLNVPLPQGQVRRQPGPLHVLTIVASPDGLAMLDPDEWVATVQSALAEPLSKGQMTFEAVKQATMRDIRRALLKQPPDIVQFVGHGAYKGGKGYLALVDSDGTARYVDDEQFANLFLGTSGHLGLVSLTACEGGASSDPQGFSGIAPQLVQRGVPAVVAMQYKVRIQTAALFLEEFYLAIAEGKPVDWATQWARNAISQEFGMADREFATPVLYMRAEDGQVF